MEKRIRQTAGEKSEEVPGQRNVSSWPFQTACTYYIHQLSTTTWVPLSPIV